MNKIDLFKLFNPDYLFAMRPGNTFLYAWPMLILFLALFAFSWPLAKHFNKSKHPRITKELLGGIPVRMREFAFLGMGLLFLRAENVPFVGMRVWLILLFVAGLVYAAWVWRRYELSIEQKIEHKQTKKVVDKYRPQPKKKSKKKKR